jgi:hypothetical protein
VDAGADQNIAAEAAPTGIYPASKSGFSRERSSSHFSVAQ